ncbi:MAG: glycosyltransferase family 2 protein [Sphaerochaeta sp.]|uniref:glycosyltransferase n=1 Tax=Sphaerochaeta sp. TaxID=1972642 RepID=UPI003D0F7FF0
MNLVLSCIIFGIGLWSFWLFASNRTYLSKLAEHNETHDQSTLVTIAVPARNEEAMIERCVRSLMQQSYANLEILVLDDNSTDHTATIVRNLQKEDARIRLITGKSLQPGWGGKIYAMQQLFEASNGKFVLFTDADTVHEPSSVSYGLGILEKTQASMLSGYPRQQAKTLGIEMLVSAMLFNPTLFVPFRFQERWQFPIFAMAIGQYLLVKREALEAFGGFISLKTEICDDVGLARLCARNGFKQVFAPLKDHVSCEMFSSFGQAWHGLERSINGVVKQGLIGFVLILAIVGVLLLLSSSPIIAVVYAVFLTLGNAHSYSLPFLFTLLGSVLLFSSWARAASYFGFSKKCGRLGLVTILLVVAMYLHGYHIRKSGRGFAWKGRILS